MTDQTEQKPAQLQRKMNLLDSTFLVIGAIVGSGIFMTTGFIADYLPSPLLILVVWLLGGFFAICGALSFAELGAMYPQAGGQYLYLRESYGPWAGFLYGWGFFWVIECGGIAALAVGFAEYFGYFVPGISTKTFLLQWNLDGFDYSLSAGQLVAAASILILTVVNYLGIKSGIVVQNIFTFLRLAAVGVLIVLGLTIGSKAGVTSLGGLFTGDLTFSIKLFGLAFIAVLWTYDGWYGLNCAAGEIKNPSRNIPLGLILGALTVTLIYFLMNIVYVMALPVEAMKGVARIGEVASTQLFGSTATFFISGTIMISIFGCLSASILYGPRVYYAMAQDRCFFQSMKFVHPRFRVPTKAIVWQGIWSGLLCLSGTYQDLFEYVVFALVIFWGATGLAVLVLRYKQPNTPRPYRTWGYPVLPVIFVLINLGVFINTVWAQPTQSLIGLAILCAGVPAFLYWKSKDKQPQL
ncbi:MAG: amino acid permease [Candidatus Aminicenantes bacterium]|nr:amino acid permease [Candidatus Aminicenantes bacterium]